MRQRHIFLFWLPLFSSWLLMTAEGPLISAAINRLPDEVVMLAAMGIVFSLEVAIESPIINLLATATALVRDRRSFRLLRRFTVHWMLALTALAAALAFTPLFDLVVSRWMGAPDEVARWVRPALAIMIPWAAAIAWRRFLQGTLIAAGRTRAVAVGTAVRLALSAGTALGLALDGRLPGVTVGALALIAGVVAEALYATWAVGPTLATMPEAIDVEGEPAELTYRELLRFHLPLASTSVLTLLMQPLVTACLARLDRPVATLAAWPLIFQFMLLMRAVAFALPEVVIALSRRDGALPALRRFSWTLTAASAAAMVLFAATPLARWYLDDVQSARAEVAALAGLGFLLLIPLPPLATLTAWLRGRLIHLRRTGAVNRAMVTRLVVTVAALATGLAFRWSGIGTAAAAIVASGAAEAAHLALRLRGAGTDA